MKCYGHLYMINDENIDTMITTHVKYIDPQIILENDNILIQGCNDRCVWFAVNEPEVDIYNLSKNPFVNLTQADSKQFVVLSHKTFLELGKKITDAKLDEVNCLKMYCILPLHL